MKYEGDVYRPPSEAKSLIIQLTVGCARNSCTFCSMYKNKRFRVRELSEVVEDLYWVKKRYPFGFERVFLADGDALIVKTPLLLAVLDKIYELFPHVQRVSTYGAAADVLLKSPEELLELRRHGLEMVYIGAETGSDRIFQAVNKNITAAETIEACLKLKAAGIKVSMTLMSGLGGKPLTRENALESARLVSAAKPEYLGLMTLYVYPDTPLGKQCREGSFQELSPLEMLEEQKLFLENVDSEGTVLRSNHVSNFVSLAGTLNRDRDAMLLQLEQAIKRAKEL